MFILDLLDGLLKGLERVLQSSCVGWRWTAVLSWCGGRFPVLARRG